MEGGISKATFIKKIMIHKSNNPELVELLKQRNAKVDEGRALSKQIDDLELERNKIGLQINKIKDKIIPIAEEIMAPILGEFQMVTTTRLTPILDAEQKPTGEFEDVVEIEWIDEVEEFKKILKERDEKNAQLKKEDEEAKQADRDLEVEKEKANENPIN